MDKKDIVVKIEIKEKIFVDDVANCARWKGHDKLFSEIVRNDFNQCKEFVDEWKNMKLLYQYIIHSDRYKDELKYKKQDKIKTKTKTKKTKKSK